MWNCENTDVSFQFALVWGQIVNICNAHDYSFVNKQCLDKVLAIYFINKLLYSIKYYKNRVKNVCAYPLEANTNRDSYYCYTGNKTLLANPAELKPSSSKLKDNIN